MLGAKTKFRMGERARRWPLLPIKCIELQRLDFVTSDYSCRSDSYTDFLLLSDRQETSLCSRLSILGPGACG
jgi:hypothetical protein